VCIGTYIIHCCTEERRILFMSDSMITQYFFYAVTVLFVGEKDMFAGIGSGIIALKRLGIPMKTIIHVEHDPVANHGKDSISILYSN
jgi:hypothetical protein